MDLAKMDAVVAGADGGRIAVNLYLKHFPPLGDPLVGGTAKALDGLATGLVACGATVTVLCEGQREGTHETRSGYVVACFANGNARFPFALAPGLRRFVHDRAGRDITVLNGMFTPSVYSVSRLLMGLRAPYVVAPHGPYHPLMFRRNAHLKWPYWIAFERRVLVGAKAVQVLDQRQAVWLRRLSIATPVIEVPNALCDEGAFAEWSRNERDNGPPTLLYLGRLDTYVKGLDLLIDAFREVTKVTQAQLVMQGPDWGDRKTLIRRAGSLLAEGKISILDADYVQSPSAVLSRCDIFCLASRYEGFGLAALEAMAAGKVLLVSSEAGIAPHVSVSGCGVVVPPTVEGIKRGLIELLERRSEWRPMGMKGQRYVMESLGREVIASKALLQYRNLLSK